MLIPFKCPECGKKYWIELSIRYELYNYVGAMSELARIHIKDAIVRDIWTDEEVAFEVQRTIASLLKEGIPRKQVVEEVSQLYGIPAIHVDELIENLLSKVPELNTPVG
ncbi:hypothetical protein [Archaeoglobus profundus]|uniref:Uncharacterized protein n=1 Tax=Archaeoglobus profundus (strain DSM 5631 / JCM 9629 / NBRC 100127 / Av18) TaxID=572546 RepID=D2RFA4_ARCPA|nr:hypothetical protein [Archaeoglobus profundus]ADB58798.1 hypothetical protein Arcpr_1754 [Archaeoglobus profundus DSM 5631]